MQLLLIPRPQTLFDELFDCLAEAVQCLLVVPFDRVDDAVLDMILQNDLADVVDGGTDRRNLNQDLRAVAPSSTIFLTDSRCPMARASRLITAFVFAWTCPCAPGSCA